MNLTINSALKEGFERQLYEASLRNLGDHANPLRINNFAYSMRELVRHVLGRLGPDEQVRRCSWFALEDSAKPEMITRKQRAVYAIQGGLSDEYVREVLGVDANAMHSTLANVIKRLSKFTHIEEKVFDLPAAEVDATSKDMEDAVVALIEAISECRRKVVSSLWEHIDQAVVFEAIRETILSIDEIATHHCIDAVYIDEVEVVEIHARGIHFKATGSIDAELQWGSNSDVKNDMGAVMSDSFPFECELHSTTEDPEAVEIDPDGLRVDTGSWDDRYGADEIEADVRVL